MRKLLALTMALMTALCMGAMLPVYAAQGEGETAHAAEAVAGTAAGKAEGQQVSEWEITENEAAALPEDVQAAFDKAKEGFDGEIVPVAYFARQLVTGSCFEVLCRVTAVPEKAEGAKSGEASVAKGSEAAAGDTADTAKPVTSYKVAVISMDLLGKVKLERMSDFNIADYTGLVAEGEEEGTDASAKEGAEVSPAGDAAGDNKGTEAAENKTPVAAEPAEPGEEIPAELLGGWSIPADYTKTALPEDVQAAFEKGAEQFFGNELVPMACLGKQTAEGTNYAVLCHSLLTTAEAVESVQVVTIYKDIDGNAYITSANTVDPTSFVKADTQAEDGADASAAGEKQAD